MTVAHSLSPAPPSDPLSTNVGDQRIAELFSPCFALILNLRDSTDFGDPDTLRDRIKDLLDRIEQKALDTGTRPDEIRNAKFAVVAFIDETLLSSNWPGKEEWMKTPLQLEFYDQFDAGEVFFDRLHTLLDDPASHVEVLEVYYLCMALGFKGKYQLNEQDRLRELIERTAETLDHLSETDPKTLAPHGPPRTQTVADVGDQIPAWVIAAAASLIGALIYVGMYLYVSTSARTVAGTIQQMAGG